MSLHLHRQPHKNTATPKGVPRSTPGDAQVRRLASCPSGSTRLPMPCPSTKAHFWKKFTVITPIYGDTVITPIYGELEQECLTFFKSHIVPNLLSQNKKVIKSVPGTSHRRHSHSPPPRMLLYPHRQPRMYATMVRGIPKVVHARRCLSSQARLVNGGSTLISPIMP
jgi:hypothetical protein